MTLVLIALIIIILLATPDENTRATAVLILGVAIVLLSLGWFWTSGLFGLWGLWKIARHVWQKKSGKRRAELKAAIWTRQLTHKEFAYINESRKSQR